VRSLVTGGTTVLLTTQYLDEADRLADRVSVVDSGRVVATGTPDELKSTIGGDRVEVVVRSSEDVRRAASLLERVGSGSIDLDLELRRISVPVRDRVAALMGALRALDDAGIPVEDVALRRPTLDEAFLSLTGRKA
jgi:ABC-2 type transport system ATP-binding protein